MHQVFIENSSLITYNQEVFSKSNFQQLEDLQLRLNDGHVRWINTYGLNYMESFREVVKQNQLDDFLLKLLRDPDHPNKVIELDGLLFIAINILKTEGATFDAEQMFFLVAPNFIWTLQEKQGDYFEWIRERLENNRGIVRRKKTDYLLFLLLESIIDNYDTTLQRYTAGYESEQSFTSVNPTPEFTAALEAHKQDLFQIKKACSSLRDTVTKLEKGNFREIRAKYFIELKEQITNLLADVDFEMQELESKINLIFSIQGHRLNEVMKTLTIFSVIFIPLTFLAGIYGMNFAYMPELQSRYGYFILLGVMVLVTLVSVWYFRKKDWL